MYNKILIKFGELTLKNKNRGDFVKKIRSNLTKIAGVETEFFYDHLITDYSLENIEKLKTVFGISFFSPVVQIETKSNLDLIKEKIKTILANYDDKSFSIVTKRADKNYFLNSQEINIEIGSFVNTLKKWKVDLRNPDLKITIEIKNNFTYIYIEKIQGLGGLPVGINGKVLHLVSGGIDSPVSAFLLMKRGIHVDFINFVTPPHTSGKTDQKALDLIQVLAKYQGGAILYKVNYTNVLNLLNLTMWQSYKIILMRRSFYRIANQVATKNFYQILTNGENIGQVASQTLEAISTVHEQSNLPILSPLLTYDKVEIIEIGKKIGTYPISIQKANETCELFAPPNPTTKPKIEKAKFLEKQMEILPDLEKKVFESIIKIKIKHTRIN